MLLKAKPSVGQTWLWTTKEDSKQIFLITDIEGDKCCGIILYDDVYHNLVGISASIFVTNFTSQSNYGLWSCIS